MLLDSFKIDHARPSWPTNLWITGLLRLFQPQIVALLEARDRAVEDWARDHPDVDVFEDRNLEITSYTEVSVEDQVHAVSRALLKRR